MKYKLRHLVEYGALRTVGAALSALPYRAALAIGWLLAVLAYGIMFRRMRRIRGRVRSVLGAERNEREIRWITWRAWRNLAFNTIEFLRLPSVNRASVEKVIEAEGVHLLQSLLGRRERFILALPHMGNWEFAGFAACLFGLPLLGITRRQRNPLIQAHLERVRALSGFQWVDRDDNVVRPVLRAMRNGRILSTFPDVRARVAGRTVRFLGGDAHIPMGIALFARLAQVPIIPTVATRVGWARHRWRTFDPIYPDPTLDRDEDLHRMTQAMMDVFDRLIREEPEQYFWFNGRWILDPLPPKRPVAPDVTLDSKASTGD